MLRDQDTASGAGVHADTTDDTPTRPNGVLDFTPAGVSRLLTGLPRLNSRTARRLVYGDVDGEYASTDALTALRLRAGDFVPGHPEHGRSLLCAFVLGAVNARWSDTHLWEALAQRPTPAGEWLRAARRRRGDEYARAQLGRIIKDARAKASASPAYASRADAGGEVAAIADLIEAHPWHGATASTDLCVLAAHHQSAERAGGLEHSLSNRQAAEAAGVSLSTLQQAYPRLEAWLYAVRVPGASDGEQDATVWRFRAPAEIRARLQEQDSAQLALGTDDSNCKSGHLPAPHPHR